MELLQNTYGCQGGGDGFVPSARFHPSDAFVSATRQNGYSLVPVVGKEVLEKLWVETYCDSLPSLAHLKAAMSRATGVGVATFGQLVIVDAEFRSVVDALLVAHPKLVGAVRIVGNRDKGGCKFLVRCPDKASLTNVTGSHTDRRIELLVHGRQGVCAESPYFTGRGKSRRYEGYAYEYASDRTIENTQVATLPEFTAADLMALVEPYFVKPVRGMKVKRQKSTAVVVAKTVALATIEQQVAAVTALRVALPVAPKVIKTALAAAEHAARDGRLAQLFEHYDDWFLRLCELKSADAELGEMIARELSRLCSNYDDTDFESQWANVRADYAYLQETGKKPRRFASFLVVTGYVASQDGGKREGYQRKRNDFDAFERNRRRVATFGGNKALVEACTQLLAEASDGTVEHRILALVIECAGASTKGKARSGAAGIGSVGQVAETLGCSVATVSKTLQRLRDKADLIVTRGNAMNGEIVVTVNQHVPEEITQPARPFLSISTNEGGGCGAGVSAVREREELLSRYRPPKLGVPDPSDIIELQRLRWTCADLVRDVVDATGCICAPCEVGGVAMRLVQAGVLTDGWKRLIETALIECQPGQETAIWTEVNLVHLDVELAALVHGAPDVIAVDLADVAKRLDAFCWAVVLNEGREPSTSEVLNKLVWLVAFKNYESCNPLRVTGRTTQCKWRDYANRKKRGLTGFSRRAA